MQLIEESRISVTKLKAPGTSNDEDTNLLFEDDNLNFLRKEDAMGNSEFWHMRKSLLEDRRYFPRSVESKISISECSADEKGYTRWRD